MVRVIQSTKKRTGSGIKRLAFVGSAAVVVATCAGLFTDTTSSRSAPAPQTSSQNNATNFDAPLGKEQIITSQSTSSNDESAVSATTSGTSTSTTSTTKTSLEICKSALPILVEKYNSAVLKEKEVLDARLSFPPVGALISVTYIDEYNADVKKAFESYHQAATASKCEISIAEPTLLPHSYTQ